MRLPRRWEASDHRWPNNLAITYGLPNLDPSRRPRSALCLPPSCSSCRRPTWLLLHNACSSPGSSQSPWRLRRFPLPQRRRRRGCCAWRSRRDTAAAAPGSDENGEPRLQPPAMQRLTGFSGLPPMKSIRAARVSNAAGCDCVRVGVGEAAAARGDGADPYRCAGGLWPLSPDLCCTAPCFSPPLCAVRRASSTRRQQRIAIENASGRASSVGFVHVYLSDSITTPPKSTSKQTDQLYHSPHREVFDRMSTR